MAGGILLSQESDFITAAMSSNEFVLYALTALALANCTKNR